MQKGRPSSVQVLAAWRATGPVRALAPNRPEIVKEPFDLEETNAFIRIVTVMTLRTSGKAELCRILAFTILGWIIFIGS